MAFINRNLLSILVAASFVASGFLVMNVGVGDYLQARVTGQGSLAVEQTIEDEFHAAALEQTAGSTLGQFVIGIFLILAGFGFHALLMTRSERSVRVRGVKHGKKARKAKKIFMWFTVRV
ncbi:hypothetical protein A3D11_00610 [Candidatus Peribacteria bacterium RIFCSPHIGHO2_02_FULL_49_16]|nr:MAG: hypothetical protein A2880_03570 [Candidatus Peribacteria bacterium RIFCSPHIGHO2_01_FULL_49_38]OGJ59488.1 MAG: hypothetical protein A3D11_00610 [Candidatus Peribacteria bacterium RIFCSPHIGHO2_02_FULL_49_16]